MGGLVLLSLVLITVSFRSTALDGFQGTVAGALRPFEIAADRVSAPFRDTISWFHGLTTARSENRKLRAEVDALRRQVIVDESAVQQNVQLQAALDYHGPPSLADFDRVPAAVLTNQQSAIEETVTIAAGSGQGIQAGDVVVEPTPAGVGGLVGTVDRAFPSVARVTLLTDNGSNVTAKDLTSPSAVGVIHRGGGGSDVLVLDRVSKAKVVHVGDTIVTAGSIGTQRFPSMYPAGISIGSVSSQSSSDVNPFQSIQVQPLVDFSSLQSVVVLVPKR